MKRNTIIIFIVLIVVIVGAYIYYNNNLNKMGEEQTDISLILPEINDKIEAPVFTLKDIEGNDITLSDYRGKVVFLNFWATWCGPCRSEMPDFDAFSKEIKKEDKAVMIAVNVKETLAEVKDYLDGNNLTLDVLLDEKGEVSSSYAINGIPTTYVIKPDGTIYNRFVGVTESKKLKLILEAIPDNGNQRVKIKQSQ